MDGRIPITIGITGHRDMDTEHISVLTAILDAEFSELKDKYPSSEIVMLNSFAEGADLVCAKIAVGFGIKVVAVLPFEKDEYIKDFSDGAKAEFESLLEKAYSVITLEGGFVDRDSQYRQAGIYVAEHSHILYALWDGQPGTAEGCGTSSVVYYLQNKNEDYLMKHIKVSRRNASFAVVPTMQVSGTENSDGKLAIIDALEKTEDFNRQCPGADDENSSKIDSVYNSSDSLSMEFQKKFMTDLKLLAAVGMLMVLSFLMFDELDFGFCLPVYGALFILGALIMHSGRKNRYHEKYMSFRLLAESLRVQKVFFENRIDCNSASLFSWTQKEDFLWIKKAIDSLTVGPMGRFVRTHNAEWLTSQRKYHESACEKTLHRAKLNSRISKICSSVTLIAVSAALIIELFNKNLFGRFVFGLSVKTIFLLLIGVLSACTLLLSSYYGKMNLERNLSDHKNMIRLYSYGEKLISKKGLSEEVIRKIVREEVTENGNWYSYMKENDLNIEL